MFILTKFKDGDTDVVAYSSKANLLFLHADNLNKRGWDEVHEFDDGRVWMYNYLEKSVYAITPVDNVIDLLEC